MLESFRRKSDHTKRLIAHCNRCGHSAIHRVEVEFEARWDDGEGYFGGEEHRILRCGGCDSVKYSVASWDSQDWEEDEDGHTVFTRSTKYFPPQQVRHMGADYIFNVPSKIFNVLSETLDAQSSNNLMLATVGLRVLIEVICDASKCKARSLINKIEELEENGFITSSEKELFHKVRAFGNKGAHLGEAMSADQIASGLDISTHLIEKLFVGPAKQKLLFDKARASLTPPR